MVVVTKGGATTGGTAATGVSASGSGALAAGSRDGWLADLDTGAGEAFSETGGWDVAVGLATPFTGVGLLGSTDGNGEGMGRDVLFTAADGVVGFAAAGVREDTGFASGSAARFGGAGVTGRVLAAAGFLDFTGALLVALLAAGLAAAGFGGLGRFSVFVAAGLAERAFAVAGLPAGRRVDREVVAAAAAFVFTAVRLPPDLAAAFGARVVDAARLAEVGFAGFARDGDLAVLGLAPLVGLTLLAVAFTDGLPEALVRRTPPRPTMPPDAGVDPPAFNPSPFIATISRSSARTRRRAVRYGRHRPKMTPVPHGEAARTTLFLDRRCAR